MYTSGGKQWNCTGCIVSDNLPISPKSPSPDNGTTVYVRFKGTGFSNGQLFITSY